MGHLVVWAIWWTAWTLIFVVAAIADGLDGDTDPDDNGVLGGIVLAILTAMLAVSGVVVSRVRRRPLPVAQTVQTVQAVPHVSAPRANSPRLPGRGSAAHEPMQRLGAAEAALYDLMAQLSAAHDGPSVPQDVVDEAWRTATETAGRLRAVAAKIEAVEIAATHTPPQERPGLEVGVHGLLAHLERGLEGYRELIAAAGHLVLAGTQEPVPDELVDATDRLAGLAAALRELSAGS